ncbi:MAG: N-acetylmuramoyl-L-alanine amidase family protein [Terracidiphilus sp.]
MAEGDGRRAFAVALICLATASMAALAQVPPAQRYTVVLDAAHGGDDTGGHSGTQSGSQSGAWMEKDTTLALSVRLRSLLAARGIAVVTTRETDTNVDRVRRDELANHANAQACLSLHASLSGTGVHLFTSSLAPAQPERIQPWSTTQAAWINRSLSFAGVLNSALQHAGLNVTLGRTALPVVDSMACPAVAIEISPEGSASGGSGRSGSDHSAIDSLSDADYQARVAEAIAAAIVEWRSPGSGAGAGQP